MSLDNKVVNLADLKVSHDYLLEQDGLLSDRIDELGSGIDGVESIIGDLSNLDTTLKNDIVSAINEVLQTGGKVKSVNGKTGDVVLKTSDLTNDSGYLTSYTETDPTVPSWAKQPSKPTYTAQEVGATSIENMNSEVNTRRAADTQLQSQITALGNGAPIPVETAAEMIDNTKAYLYTGAEAGWLTGCWYTYDSTQAKFIPRGEYGAGVIIDSTLTVTGNAADAKATGDAISEINGRLGEQEEIVERLNEGGLDIKDEVIETQITDWLNNHPEATTTVQDGAISEAKLASALKPKIMNTYATPQMYGAVGDGVADDTTAIQTAINNHDFVYIPGGTYLITESIRITSRKTIAGDGFGTVILFKSTTDGTFAFHVDGSHGLSSIKNLEIIGNGENDTVEIGGVSLDDRPSTGLVEFDAMNVMENVLVRKVSGTAFYIGTSQRGNRFTKCTAYFVGGYGFNVAGTDNMIQFCSTGVSGKTGFLISQNNRIVSIKAFRCGEKDPSSYYGIHITKSFNNLSCIDIQENHVTGLKIDGNSNTVYFNADANGTKDDPNGALSLIEFGERACFNRLIGIITQGTLGYYVNGLVKTDGMSINLENHLNLLYNEALTTSLYDITYLYNELSPGNQIEINGKDYSTEYEDVNIPNIFAPIYIGHAGWADYITPVDGVYSFSAPLSFNELSEGSGINMRAKLIDLPGYDTTKLKTGSRLCISFDIDSNVPNDKIINVNAVIYTNSKPYAFWRGTTRKTNKGLYTGILYCTDEIVTGLKSESASNIRLGLVRFSNDSPVATMPENTSIEISNIRFKVLY